jgi:hypothetical protein
LSSAISSFKEFVGRRKKPCTTQDLHEVSSDKNILPPNIAAASSISHLTPIETNNVVDIQASVPENHLQSVIDPIPSSSISLDGQEMSLAEHRPRHQNRQKLKRFRDVLPQPPPTVLVEIHDQLPELALPVVGAGQGPALLEHVYRTPPNIFGLVCQYFSVELPSHDLEEYITMADLLLIPGTTDDSSPEPLESSSDARYHPYPNQSSFQLGDWYWNQGVQKSQANYTKLVDIVGRSTFQACSVSSTNWRSINTSLGINNYDKGDIKEWEDKDTGWIQSPISIQVPFACTTATPGPCVYHASHLYHCPLVSMIQEKLANAQDTKLFHYKPYQLCWAPPHLDTEVSIYGDLYTSPVFHKAHQEVQNLMTEPGCDLPWAVAALMFWSDATQLTLFGNAKLWPTYMYFGNKSKYRHCKPSCNLSNQIAYFETVSTAH